MGAQPSQERMGTGRVNGLTLIDTDILIDAALEREEAVACLDQIERESGLVVSIITQLELLAGCRNKAETRNVDHFLERFQVINLNESIGDIALDLFRQYRMSHGLMIPDALIAATALAIEQPLISKNQMDYRFISGLTLMPYPS